MQESLSAHDDYILKTNEQLLDQISEFGCGETEFHTADIERLIKENEEFKKFLRAELAHYNRLLDTEKKIDQIKQFFKMIILEN